MAEMGRPRLFNTVEELESKIEEYFDYIKGEYTWITDSDEDGKPIDSKQWTRHSEPPTITGLAYFLGFESRQSIHDYEKNGNFSYTIKRARILVEKYYEIYLTSGNSPSGAIFALKNFGWIDRTELDHTTKGERITPPITWVDANPE